jgi:hypothetical protein
MLASVTHPTTLAQSGSSFLIRLVNRAGTLLQKLRPNRGLLRAADLIEAAKRRTGLDDFGGGEFFEPLSRLLESCHREARLNVVGRIVLKCDVVRTLSNRLLMQRDRQLNPQIALKKIEQPLFIVGLPRSGTTLLHMLLASDPANRVPVMWEVMSPSPPSDGDQGRRIRRAALDLALFQWLAPTFDTVHPTGAEMPQECVSLMGPTFMSDQFDTMYDMPSYRAWFLKQDQSLAYQYHCRFLQQLQHLTNSARWILKAPAHMFAPRALLSTYPDALFVHTHREPIEAIASVSSLVAILRSVFSDVVDPIQIGRDAMEYWAEALRRFMQERDRLPPGRICDLPYSEIQRDPLRAVRCIYDYFGWLLKPETERRMRLVLARQTKSQNGSHRYWPAQFGLEDAGQFGVYRERFGLGAVSPVAASSATRIANKPLERAPRRVPG